MPRQVYVSPPYSGSRVRFTNISGLRRPMSRARFLQQLGSRGLATAARQGARFAGSVYKHVKKVANNWTKKPIKRKSPTSANRGFVRGLTGHSVGTYKGSFKKAKRIKKTMKSMALAKGFHKTLEQYGTVTSSDCVYLGHSSGNLTEMSEVIYSALMRKIMNKAGFKMSSLFRELAVSNPGSGVNFNEDATGLRFVYTVMLQSVGTTNNVIYDTLNGQNFGDVLLAFTQFRLHLLDFIRGEQGAGAREAYEPFKLAVYTKDVTATIDQWRLGAEMFLEDVHLELSCNSIMTIQNRTKAAEATTDFGTERVDSQPLKGYLYEFKHADPRVRFASSANEALNNNQVFNRMNANGLSLIRGNQFGPSNEPLDPKYFANIAKATKITLDPGEMKKMTFSYRVSGKITNILKKLQVTRYHSVTGVFNGQIGKCQFFAFEELMRTPSNNLITVAYERELQYGAIVKYKYSDTPLDDSLTQIEISNNEV